MSKKKRTRARVLMTLQAATAVVGVSSSASFLYGAATTGWLQTAVGNYSYTFAGNWVGGNVNGVFDATDTFAGAQTVVFDAPAILGTGLAFGYTGNFALTLDSSSTTPQTMTLGGDVSVTTPTGTTANVTIGNASNALNVDLGGATRTLTVNASRTLTLVNTISNGGLVLTGGGTLQLATAAFSGGIAVNAGTLVLNSSNTYSGGTAINGGTVSVLAASNLGSNAGGNNVTVSGGAMLTLSAASNVGSNQTVTATSSATNLATIGLTFNGLPTAIQAGTTPWLLAINNSAFNSVSSEALGSTGNIFLGSTGGGTFTGTTLSAGNDGNYRLGGGGSALSISNGVLIGAAPVIIGSTAGNGGGTVTLLASNATSGATSIIAGTLKLSGASGALPNSDIAATSAGTVIFDSSTATVAGTTRSNSVTLKGSALNVIGNTNGTGNVSSVETIAGALTADVATTPIGPDFVTLSGGTATNWQLAANNLARANNGVIVFRGTNLGSAPYTNAVVNSSNIKLAIAPSGANFVGGGGTSNSKNINIIPWALGDTSAAGSGSSFVTYDANGIRPLAANEYDNTIPAAVSTNNVMLAANSTVSYSGDTTVNSLFLNSNSSVGGTGKLTVTSGAVFASYAATNITLSKQLDFGSVEGVIGTTNGVNKGLGIGGGISGTGGVTFYTTPTRTGGDGGVLLNAATTYSGNTTIIGGVTANAVDVLPNGSRTGDLFLYGQLDINSGANSQFFINGLNGSGLISHGHSQSGIVVTVGDNDASGNYSGTITNFGQLNFNKIGTGTQTYSGSATYTGSSTVGGGTVKYVDAGSSINSNGFTLRRGATLLLDNSGSVNSPDRIGPVAISTSMGGGTFKFQGANDAASTETVGALTEASGFFSVNSTLGSDTVAAGTPSNALTFASLGTRNAGAVVSFSGSNLGTDGTNKIAITAGPTLTNDLIGPWATIGNEFATYNEDGVGNTNSNGVQAANITNTTFGAANNVKLTSAGALGTAAYTLNLQTASSQTFTFSGGNLAVAGILNSGTGTNVISGGSVGSTTGVGGELVITTNGNLTFDSTASITGAALGLTKNGSGVLTLSKSVGASGRTSGVTFIDQGTLRITDANALNDTVQTTTQDGLITVGANATFEVGTTASWTAGTNKAPIINLNDNGATLKVSGGSNFTTSKNTSITSLANDATSVNFTALTAADTLTLNSAVQNTTGGTAAPLINVNGLGTVIVGSTASNGTTSGSANNGLYNWAITGGGKLLVTSTGASPLGLAGNTVKITSGVLGLGQESIPGYAYVLNGGVLSATGTSPRTINAASTMTLASNTTSTIDLKDAAGSTNMTVSYAGSISGAGNLVVAASGTPAGGLLTLTGSNTFTGTTAINSGTLAVNAVATGTNPQPLGENTSANAVSLGVAGTSSGVLKYTGGTGSLDKNITALGSGADTISNTGGGMLTLSGTVTKANTTLTFAGGAISVSGQVTGGTAANFNSDLVVNAGATVTLSNASNNYTGATNVNGGGTLKNGIASALPTGTVVTLGSAGDGAVTNTYDLSGFDQTIAALNSTSSAGPNANVVTNGGASGTNTLTLSGTNSDSVAVNSTFGGVIQNGSNAATALQITGGTHTLTNNNTYTGQTTIAGGTLALGPAGSIGGSAKVLVGDTSAHNAAVFDVSAVSGGYHVVSGQTLGGFGTVHGATTVDASATIAPGASVGKLSFDTASSTALTLSGTYQWELGALKDDSTGTAGTDFDQIALTGNTGNVALGGSVTLSFINSIADPNTTDGSDGGFWSTNHSWTIVAGTNSNTNIGNTQFAGITNATWQDGNFTTVADANGNDMLTFTTSATPEPGSIGVLVLGGIGLLRRRRRST